MFNSCKTLEMKAMHFFISKRIHVSGWALCLPLILLGPQYESRAEEKDQQESGQKVWTLDDCISYALENNISLKRTSAGKGTMTTFRTFPEPVFLHIPKPYQPPIPGIQQYCQRDRDTVFGKFDKLQRELWTERIVEHIQRRSQPQDHQAE